MKPLDPLDHKIRSLIDQVRAADQPPPELEEALLRSLTTKLQQPLPPTAAAAQRAFSSGAGAPLASSVVVKLVVGALAVSVAGTAVVRYSRSTEAHVSQRSAAAESSAPVSQPKQLPAAGASHATLAATPGSLAAAAALAEGTGSLAEETQLVAQAQRALQSGDASAALTWVDKHTGRYPNGALAQERDAVRVFSLCALRRNTEAQQAQQHFAHDWPNSPLAKRVLSDCPKQ